MSKQKLTPDERRALVLAALSGVPVLQLSKEYGVARSWIYVLLEEVKRDPEYQTANAWMEYQFRAKALEILSKDPTSVKG